MNRRPPPRSFFWCVQRLDLGDPMLTMIARGVCWAFVIWPEQLVGFARAGDAVSDPENPPISGDCTTTPRVVDGRHACYALARELTPLSAAAIGEAFGGHTADTVRRHWRRASFLAVGDELEVALT